MLSKEKQMDVLEAYDLTKSLRAAAELTTSSTTTPWPAMSPCARPESPRIPGRFNLHPSGFDQLMDKTIASALVHRLLHHAHVIVTEGESVRLIDATSGKLVVPLAS